MNVHALVKGTYLLQIVNVSISDSDSVIDSGICML